MAVTDGDVLKVVLDIDCPDLVIAQNVFYYQMDDPVPNNPTNAQIMTALDAEFTALCQHIDQLTSDDYDYDEIKVDRIEWNVDNWETVENLGTASITVPGTAVANAAPHGVAVTITGNTSRPQTRARKFLPGISEGEMDHSTISGTLITALTSWVAEWVGGRLVTGSATLDPVVVGQSGPSAGLVYAIVTGVINGVTGYQRRRKPGVGA